MSGDFESDSNPDSKLSDLKLSDFKISSHLILLIVCDSKSMTHGR